MKTTVQKEGLDFSTRHDFGNPENYLNEFQFVVSYVVGNIMDDFKEELYYYQTSDGYIQVCNKKEWGEPSIVAQFKLTDELLKVQLKNILKRYFMSLRFYTGYPRVAIKGGILLISEFVSILGEIDTEMEQNKKIAENNPPELTPIFKEHKLNPHPNENGDGQWLASCAKCRKFYIVFWNYNLKWGCGRCSFHGEGEQELRTALEMLANPTEENKKKYEINIRLGDLRSLKTEQERIDAIADDIQSGQLRYKIVDDEDFNLIFKSLYGCELEEIEREQVAYCCDKQDINGRFAAMEIEEAIEVIKKVYATYEPSEDMDWIAESFKDNDYVDIEWCFTGENLDEFVDAYNEVYRDEEIDCGNYVYNTYVTMESSDGFELHYALGWTEGEPEYGELDTPYSDL